MAKLAAAGPPGGAGRRDRGRGGTGRRRADRRRPAGRSAAGRAAGVGRRARGAAGWRCWVRRFRACAAIPTASPPAGHLPRFAEVDVDGSPRRLAEILRAENAAVLTSYDANGGYGHPDHVAVHQVGALAAALGRHPGAARGHRSAGSAAGRRPAGEPVAARVASGRPRAVGAARTRARRRSRTASTSGARPGSAGRRCGRTPARRLRTAVRAPWGCSPGSRRRCSAGSFGREWYRQQRRRRQRPDRRAGATPAVLSTSASGFHHRGDRRRCRLVLATRVVPAASPTARPTRPAPRTGSPGCA